MASSTAPPMFLAAAKFFTASQYAVAGASSIPHKFGYKIFDWYLSQSLPAIPVNPTIPSIIVDGKEFKTVASPLQLKDPKNTSLSIITPPAVTAKVLKEAREVGVLAVWLQPGSFGEAELRFAVENWKGGAVGGFGEGTGGHEGWCVLVDREGAMEEAGRLLEREGKGKRRQVDVSFDEGRRGRADGCSTVHRISKRPKGKKDPVVGRKARVKRHVMDHVGRTENIRLRRVLANLEG